MTSSTSLSSVRITVIVFCMLHLNLVTTKRDANGDGIIELFKDDVATLQQNIYLGDEFLMDITMRSGNQYMDINLLNVTQYRNVALTPRSDTENAGKVSVLFKRVENDLFNVTSVYPVNVLDGGNATILTKTKNYPHKYQTYLTIKNSRNSTLPSDQVKKIMLSSHRIVTNTGIRIEITPNA